MYSQNKFTEITDFAKEIRINTLEQFVTRGFGHLGGSMSIVEILSVLYGDEMKYDPKNPNFEQRDYLVCSKGHAGPAIYSALALKGFFPMDWLHTLNQNGTNLPSHCDKNKTPGIDATTGSLGQGLSTACGIALSHKTFNKDNYTFAIVGDGELQEGQNWEAASFAAFRKLSNLILFVDCNKFQLDNTTASINDFEKYEEKFESFNWNVIRINGHDINEIKEAIVKAKQQKDKPTAIICDTIKGKGVTWAETVANHHIEVSREKADIAIAEIRG